MKSLVRLWPIAAACAGLALAACSDDSPLKPSGKTFVVTGQITDAGAPLAAAEVKASAAGDSRIDTTDGTGFYLLQLDAIPDSVQICVSARGFLDTCADFLVPPETLRVDVGLKGVPHDTVWLTTDTVTVGDTAELVLNLSNPDSALAGMNLWLRSPGPDIVFDTVYLVSPRFPVFGMEWNVVRHDSINTIAILFIDFQGQVLIPPGRGPLMHLRYRVDAAQTPGSFPIDTTSAVVARPIDISYGSGLSAPGVVFKPGSVVVR